MSSTKNSQPPAPCSTPPAPIPGRPRALDEPKRREICAMVATGCGLASAARYVGCDVSTIRREARRNPDFAQRLRRAQRDCELAPLDAMRKAARRYWRAAAWLLERLNAERYGKTDAQNIKREQLHKYTDALTGIVAREVENELFKLRLIYNFRQVRDHCDRQIAAAAVCAAMRENLCLVHVEAVRRGDVSV